MCYSEWFGVQWFKFTWNLKTMSGFLCIPSSFEKPTYTKTNFWRKRTAVPHRRKNHLFLCKKLTLSSSGQGTYAISFSNEVMQLLVQHTSQKDASRKQWFWLDGIRTILQLSFLLYCRHIKLKIKIRTVRKNINISHHSSLYFKNLDLSLISLFN